MLRVYFIEKRQGVREEGLLGRAAGTSSIASVMQQVDSMAGKRIRKTRVFKETSSAFPPK
jgi:hypothetical protein